MKKSSTGVFLSVNYQQFNFFVSYCSLLGTQFYDFAPNNEHSNLLKLNTLANCSLLSIIL